MRNRHGLPIFRSLQGIHNLVFKQWRFVRYLWIVAVLLFMAVYVIGDYGLVQIYFKLREVHRLGAEIAQLENEYATLKRQKAQLETGDKEFLERIAREKFGMIKNGESLYRVVIGKDRNDRLDEIRTLPDPFDKEIP